VIEPIEQINGHWVVFGLGNILSNLPTEGGNWLPATQDGMVVSVEISRQPDGSITVGRPVVDPTWVDKSAGFRVRVVADSLNDPDLPAGTRLALAASLKRTTAAVGGFIRPTAV
jgi:hypothetical protein